MPAKAKEPSVKQSWQRLDRWFKKHLPGVARSLNPGVSEKQLATFERRIGHELPVDVRESYLIHNGQKETRATGCIFGLPLLPLKFVREQWEGWRGFENLNDEFRWSMKSYP